MKDQLQQPQQYNQYRTLYKSQNHHVRTTRINNLITRIVPGVVTSDTNDQLKENIQPGGKNVKNVES